jgi:integrase
MLLESLEDLLALYIKERDPSEATIKGCREVLGLFMRESMCANISDVTHDVLLDWKAVLKVRASEASVNTYLRTLRTLFNFAEQRGVLSSENPFRAVSYMPEYSKLKHTAEHIEITNLLGMIRESPKDHPPSWFWEAVLLTLYYTGMRRRQLVELRWGDIDFDRDRILLRAEGSKTRREWHIPMLPVVAQALLAVRAKTLEKLGLGQPATLRANQVFNITLFHRRYAGDRMKPEQVTGFFKRASKRYQIKISPHRFRHTFATQAANRGGQNLTHLQKMLGHTSIKTTLGYVHSDTESMRLMVGGLRLL